MCRCVLAAALFIPLALGCQKSSGNVNVSGIVKKDGAPLANAHVLFHFQGADGKTDLDKEAGGETDAEGRYSLKRIGSDVNGAAPGKYRVEIHAIERSGTAGIRELLPPKYNRESKLEFTVSPGGSKEANFDLQTK